MGLDGRFKLYFYPRSPCGERPRTPTTVLTLICISIHALLAESDDMKMRMIRASKNFYPRSPCGERRGSQQLSARPTKDFYPRSPCGERHKGRIRDAINLTFLSTLSLRRATEPPRVLREPTAHFYPRSPCGERQRAERHANSQQEFLSTLSLRRATLINCTSIGRPKRFLSTLSLRRATAKVHKTVGHFCAYETNFMGIASSC